MTSKQEWASARDDLIEVVVKLGFPMELGAQMAKELGSPKAMRRMESYLVKVKPKSVELVVDEMLAICSEIDAWREKKASEAANAAYNEMLMHGFEEE